jgi:regulator of sigma E protease
MDIIVGYVIPFLIILSVVVFVHEYGHYWVARRCGVRVEVFSIGFGRELFGFNDKNGTRWKFSLIPLGGYVRCWATRMPPAPLPIPRHLAGESLPAKSVGKPCHRLRRTPPPTPLRHRRLERALRKRAARSPRPSSVTSRREPGGRGRLEPGDRITAVDGRVIECFRILQTTVRDSAEVPHVFTFERDGAVLDLNVTRPCARSRTASANPSGRPSASADPSS